MMHLNMLSPTALLALLLVIPVVAAHLYYRSLSRKVRVPFMPIWDKVFSADPKSGFTRIKRTLLLAVRIAFICALALAFADPVLSKTPKPVRHLAFVFDNSASMSSRFLGNPAQNEPTVADGTSRLDLAKAQALELLDSLNMDVTKVSVVISAPVPSVVCRGTSSISSAEFAIKSVTAEPSASGWDKALDFAQKVFEPSETPEFAVFTDDPGARGDVRFILPSRPGPVSNLAISFASASRDAMTETVHVTCQVSNEMDIDTFGSTTSSTAANGVLRFEFGGKELSAENFSIPRGLITVVQKQFSLPSAGMLKVWIDAGSQDAMPLDSVRFIAVPPMTRPRIILVSDGSSRGYWDAALAAVAKYYDKVGSFSMTPEQFESLTEHLHKDDIIIFSSCAPKSPVQKGSCIYLGSRGGAVPVKTGPESDAPVFWNSSRSTLMEGVDLRLLKVRSAVSITASPDEEVLFSFSGGPGAVRGTGPSGKYVFVSFGLEESNLGFLVAFPILVKNCLMWSSGAGDDLAKGKDYGFYDSYESFIIQGVGPTEGSAAVSLEEAKGLWACLSVWPFLIAGAIMLLLFEFAIAASI